MKNLISKFALQTAVFFGAVAMSWQAHALVYSVNKGDSAGLADAIVRSNASPDPDVIELEAGVYTLKDAVKGKDGWVALPVITGQLLIRGAKAEVRAYTRRSVHLIEVASGAVLKIEGVTLAEGTNGALVNYGKAELYGVSVIDQTTRSAAAIVSNFGDLTLARCELSFNTISASQNAGTIINYGFVAIKHTRIRGNVVSRQFQSLVLASVLLNYGMAELQEVALLDNEAVSGLPSLSLDGVADALINQGVGTMKVGALHSENNFPVQ
jgi:hypothetical protein